MKKIVFILMMITIGLTFSSCNNDGYSLDDFVVRLATIDSINENTFSLRTDNGQNLWPTNTIKNSFVAGQRVIANYTILSDSMSGYDHFIRINSLNKVLTKGVIDLTIENADSIGNDPIRIFEIWSGGDFMNIEFGYNYNTKTHMLNLVNNTTIEHPDDGKIYLELQHNAFQDGSQHGGRGIVCFDIKPFRNPEKKSVEFVITNNDFGNKRTFNIIYKY